MKKKLLSLLLVLCMVLPMVPVGAIVVAAAGGVTVTFYDADGGVMTTESANYGDLVKVPDYPAVAGNETFWGWDINNDGVADYTADGYVVVQKGYTDVKAVVTSVLLPEEGDVTKFSDNYPQTDSGFRGNWEAGTFDASENYDPFTKFSSPFFVNSKANAWGWGGLYHVGDGHSLIFTVIKSVYSSVVYNVTRDANITIDYDQLIVRRESTTSSGCDMDFNICVNGVVVWPTGTEDSDGDGWYNYSAGCGHTSTNEHNITSLFDSLTIDVEAGDVISFRSKRSNDGTFMAKMMPTITFNSVGANTIPTPETPVVSTTSAANNIPVYQNVGQYVAKFSNNWSWVGHGKNNYSDTVTIDTVRYASGWTSTDPVTTDGFISYAGATGLWSVHPVARIHGNTSEGGWGAQNSFAANHSYNAGWRYVAEKTGRVSIDIDKVVNHVDAANAAFAIFVNGTMVWPTVEGSWTDRADWFTGDRGDLTSAAQSTADYDVLSDIFVVEGDAIEFLVKSSDSVWTCRGAEMYMTVTYNEILPEGSYFVKYPFPAAPEFAAPGDTIVVADYTGNGDFVGWDIDGDGRIDYIPGEEFTMPEGNVIMTPVSPVSSSANNTPINSQNGAVKVQFKNGWTWVAHPKDNISVTKVLNTNYGTGYSTPSGWVQTGPFIGEHFISFEGSAGLDSAVVQGVGDNTAAYWGAKGQFATGNQHTVGWSYTAPYTGYVTIDIDLLTSVNGSNKVGYAIFAGGTMIWPTTAGSYASGDDWFVPEQPSGTKGSYADQAWASDTYDNLARVFVVEGDSIELLVKGVDGQSVYGCKGVGMDMTVTYTELLPKGSYFIKYPFPAEPQFATAGENVTLNPYTGNDVFLGWDVDGDGKVDYADGQNIEMPAGNVILSAVVMNGASGGTANMPIMNADGTLTFVNGWKYGMVDRLGNKFIPYNSYNSYFYCFFGDVWGTGLTGMYHNGRFVVQNSGLNDQHNVGMQYTVETGGYVSIKFDTLTISYDTNSAYTGKDYQLQGGVAIFLNGMQVAPYDDYIYYTSDYVNYSKQNSTGELKTIANNYLEHMVMSVRPGDVIEIRGTSENITGMNTYMTIAASISYEAISSAPEVEKVDVTFGETYNLNVYANLNAPRNDYYTAEEATDAYGYYMSAAVQFENLTTGEQGIIPAIGMTDNSVPGSAFCDVDFIFNLPAVDAKHLSDEYQIRVGIQYKDGSVVWSDWTYVDIIRHAGTALTNANTSNEEKIASAAVVEYAKALDMYFTGNTNVMSIPEPYMPVLPTVEPEDVFNLTEFDGVAEITGATLLIEEAIKLRIYIQSAEDMATLRLQMDDNDGFRSPRDLTIVARAKGGYVVDIDISTVDFSTAFNFRVVDHEGEQQSGVLTYSVESYVARTIADENADRDLVNLLNAMLTVCKAVDDLS